MFLLLLTTVQKEPFRTNQKTTSISIMNNLSPSTLIEGIQKRIHPYIPLKQHYYKLKRKFRNKI